MIWVNLNGVPGRLPGKPGPGSSAALSRRFAGLNRPLGRLPIPDAFAPGGAALVKGFARESGVGRWPTVAAQKVTPTNKVGRIRIK